jgi:hypothetical protein
VKSRLETLKHALEIALAFIASACFGASFGYSYGLDNQVVYMLSAERLLDRTILNRDWFATQTTHYHLTFKYIAALLLAIDHRGWAVAIAQNVAITAGMMAVYALFRVLIGRPRALPAFFLVLAVAGMTRTSAASASYVFDIILQPSTLGSVCLLATVPFFAQGRWLASSVFLALSGLFHANYLVLLLMAFTVAHLLLGREGLFGRLLLQFALPSLVLLLFLPMILGTAGSQGAAAAQNIYFNIRAPHHFVPGNAERDFIPFLAWQAIGAGAALHYLQKDARFRRLGALIGGLLFIIWVGLVCSTLFHVRQLTQLFAWRLGPHTELLLQILACAGVLDLFLDPSSPQRKGVFGPALLFGGLGFLAMYQGDRGRPELAYLVLPVAAFAAVAKLLSVTTDTLAPPKWSQRFAASWRRNGPTIAFFAALGAALPITIDQMSHIKERSSLLNGGVAREEAELYAWMRDHTPKDALFLTPPDVEKMRYHGQRAIVVDWKSNPIVPGEVLEWYRRLQDVTGRPSFSGGRDLDGYNQMDKARLELLKTRYGLDYAIVRKGREAGLGGYRTVHQNGWFTVLDLHSAP